MEIKFKQGDSVTIPEGCKAVINDGVVVFEREDIEFKDGDILHAMCDDAQVIFKNNAPVGCFCSYYNTQNRSNHGWRKAAFRLSTEEERQLLFDKMKEQGLRWNAEEKRVERIRWRAEHKRAYYCISAQGDVMVNCDAEIPEDEEKWDFGNYFRTSEQAEQAADAVKMALMKFHEENE